MTSFQNAEVYYVLGHGILKTYDTLDHKDRHGIPIISIGMEGEPTYVGPTLLLIMSYMKKYGNRFMKKLLYILKLHGDKYINNFKPDKTQIQKDIRFLFDMNKKEQEWVPNNKLNVYYGKTSTILNTTICSNIPNETLLYDTFYFKKNNEFLVPNYQLASVPEKFSSYEFYDVHVPGLYGMNEKTHLYHLKNPFGIFHFDNINRNFILDYRFTNTKTHTVKDILQEIHFQSQSKKPILFMCHCKTIDKDILMDIDLKDYPIEKGHKKSLFEIMKSLRKLVQGTDEVKQYIEELKQLTQTTDTTKLFLKKRKLEDRSPDVVIKKKTKLSPPIKRTKVVVSPKTKTKKTKTKTNTKTKKTKTNTKTKKTKLGERSPTTRIRKKTKLSPSPKRIKRTTNETNKQTI